MTAAQNEPSPAFNSVSAGGAAGGGLVSIDVRSDGVAMVVYDVPGEAVNTLKTSFAAEFERAFERIMGDNLVRAAVLCSGKPDSFIAGADIDMLKSVKTAADAEALSRVGQQTLDKLAHLGKPVVAAIHGPALGGGFEIALACHGRVVTNDKKTVLGFPEVQLGLLPGMDGLQRLASIVGLQVALDYGLTGKNMYPSKARALGVVDDVVAPPILRQVAAELALALADRKEEGAAAKRRDGAVAGRPKKAKLDAAALTRFALEKNPLGRALLFKKAREATLRKTRGNYPAPERIIEVLQTYADRGLEGSREVEARAFGELAATPEAQNLMRLFFATTALKKDSGVDDPNVRPRRVSKVEVLGAGLMGSGIALVTTRAGINVRLKDRDDPSVARGYKAVVDSIDERVKARQMTRFEREQQLALVTTTTDYSGLKNAEIVIEAVFEDLAIKHQVLRDVEANGREGIIFASNTSSIPIRDIASAAKHPENVVGMHYFSPVPKMPLLEVIRTSRTAPEVIATAVGLGKKQGKTVIVVNDGVGFYTTRILSPYLNEASWILSEGVAIDVIDRALVEWGWPVGPLALIDEVGIDIAGHVVTILRKAFGERIAPPPTIEKLLADGRNGRKNAKGFYVYDKTPAKKGKRRERGKGKEVDTSVYATLGLEIPTGTPKVSRHDIQMRCSLQFVNEALHCYGEGILRSARDGDVGAILGLGFPPFRGGPFRLVDEMGPREVLSRIERYREQFGARFTPAPALIERANAGRRFLE